MKWLIACSALAWPALARAAPEATGWSVHTDVQMVALPLTAACRLAPGLRRAETFAAANATVQAMLQTGEAVLLGWPMTDGVPGTDSFSQSTRGIQWPMEFDAPLVPGSFSGPVRTPPDPSTSLTAPTSFEVTEVGPVLESSAQVDAPGDTIQLKLAVRFRRLTAMEPATGARSERLGDRRIVQPRFAVWNITTSLGFPNGGGLLVGQFLDGGPQPRMVLFLLHASAKLRRQ